MQTSCALGVKIARMSLRAGGVYAYGSYPEIDELFPVAETLQLLRFAEIEEGVLPGGL